MNRLCISIRLLSQWIVIGCLMGIPAHASSPFPSGGQASPLRGSCAVISSMFSQDSARIRHHCERFAPRDVDLEVIRGVWDPALQSWMLLTRCAHRNDCIPFWLTVPEFPRNIGSSSDRLCGQPASARCQPSSTPQANTIVPSAPQPLVRPGQKATLLWDQDGIHLEAQVVCLDKGTRGDRVRARIARGKIVHAVVVSSELLKVES